MGHLEQWAKLYRNENRYALDRGKPLLAFVHKDIGQLPANKADSEPSQQLKLREFRAFVQKKTCRFWSNARGLGGVEL